MSITAIRATAATPHPMRRAGDFVVGKDRVADRKASRAPTETSALTPTEHVERSEPVSSVGGRPDASFVTHLLATAEQVPQTRQLRRAEIADVEAAYRAAGLYSAASTGRTRLMV
jgi:hypothetical protein